MPLHHYIIPLQFLSRTHSHPLPTPVFVSFSQFRSVEISLKCVCECVCMCVHMPLCVCLCGVKLDRIQTQLFGFVLPALINIIIIILLLLKQIILIFRNLQFSFENKNKVHKDHRSPALKNSKPLTDTRPFSSYNHYKWFSIKFYLAKPSKWIHELVHKFIYLFLS